MAIEARPKKALKSAASQRKVWEEESDSDNPDTNMLDFPKGHLYQLRMTYTYQLDSKPSLSQGNAHDQVLRKMTLVKARTRMEAPRKRQPPNISTLSLPIPTLTEKWCNTSDNRDCTHRRNGRSPTNPLGHQFNGSPSFPEVCLRQTNPSVRMTPHKTNPGLCWTGSRGGLTILNSTPNTTTPRPLLKGIIRGCTRSQRL